MRLAVIAVDGRRITVKDLNGRETAQLELPAQAEETTVMVQVGDHLLFPQGCARMAEDQWREVTVATDCSQPEGRQLQVCGGDSFTIGWPGLGESLRPRVPAS